ncbi:MAG TPA: SAP domain-containing protein [Thermoplasmata archaeon]|nr:SAP domain-containing protein [Thermoplasmata archaeon]
MADLPCPNCGTPLAFFEQYQRYYCLRCGQYAPEGYGDRGAKRCATCGGVLSFVTQYNRFYCYRCNTYAADEPGPAETPPVQIAPAASAPNATPSSPPAAIAPATTELAVAPSSPEATLVSAATPTPAVPTVAPTPQGRPAATPEAATPPAVLEVPPTAIPEPAAAEKPSEPAPAEPSPEIRRLAASKPAIVRVKIFTLKKSELIDLCKAYNLDPSGTKEQVQERLLSYLHDLEAEETPSEEPDTTAEETVPAAAAFPTPVAVVEPAPAPKAQAASTVETHAAPAAVVQVQKPESSPVVVEVPRTAAKIEHPCPNCGRELTFIAQYDRYYCYFCQRYAPAARAKGACPTCGATMRWIDQHQRWWCDACQKYAPADLPKPAIAAAARPAATASSTTTGISRPAIVIHHHASPAMGMGLIGVGVVLWIIYEVFGVLAPAVNLAVNSPFSDGLGAFIEFFAFLFVAAGALIGLSSLRDRI